MAPPGIVTGFPSSRCVRVCSRNAKEVLDTTGLVRTLLEGPARVAACVAPSFPAEFTDCDWRKIVGMIRAMGFDIVAEKNVTVEIHCDGPLMMKADREEIEIILNNLISNAVKYNRPDGRVDVTLSAGDDDVTIAVADTGIAI